ncbi:MAG: DNA repair protein RecO [Xanthomonadaceae bacterium]|jgi:DNA repair protein RecO (recombination protein O)|nr:DNA repair protein RecO [Xanthomonadaceae bacterium]
MRFLVEPAFVLHARPWRESSLLVDVLSEQHGRIGLIARGICGPKRQHMRAALQPLQHIRLDATLRGELAQLRAVEALDTAPRLTGTAMLAGFYLNELVLRLTPRLDPLPLLYAAYERTRACFGRNESLAWTLRRFERDLLDALGVGFPLHHDGEGEPVDPNARYRLEPEYGPRRSLGNDRHVRDMMATGSALLALASDRMPVPDDLASLRLPMRMVLAYHLGAYGLKSWEVSSDLGRLERKP